MVMNMSKLTLWRAGVTVSFSIAFIITCFMLITAFIEIIGYLNVINYTRFSALPTLSSTVVGLIGAPLIWNKIDPRAN